MTAADPRRRLALVLAAGFLAVGCKDDEPVAAPKHPLADDPRMAELLDDCYRSSFYDRFVDDMTPILVEKLRTVGGEPLKRAKEELGALGSRAVPELRRLVDESFADPMLGPHLENAIDALCLNDAPEVHEVLFALLAHPADTVRQRAMQGIVARHTLPEDFDDMRMRAEGSETPDIRRLYVRAMFLADPVRAARVGVSWIKTGELREYAHTVAPLIAEIDDAEVAKECAVAFQGLGETLAPWIAAPAARYGDAEALAYLEDLLDASVPSYRIAAVRALQAAGLAELLGETITSDPDDTVRVFAIEAVASQDEVPPEQIAWISGVLNDGSSTVRSQALQRLCALGDPAALDLALSHLKEGPVLLQPALLALKDPMIADEKLARRAYETLLERHRLEELRPLEEQAATFKAMGLVPLADAARFLRRVALEHPDDRIEGLTAHDWMMIQASNTGQPGREFLWSELANERDPVRRIELIAAATSSRDPDVKPWIRQRLFELIEGDDVDSGYELLFAAGRLVKIGPSSLVAPRLKRIVNQEHEPVIQVGLQCLMWTWY